MRNLCLLGSIHLVCSYVVWRWQPWVGVGNWVYAGEGNRLGVISGVVIDESCLFFFSILNEYCPKANKTIPDSA